MIEFSVYKEYPDSVEIHHFGPGMPNPAEHRFTTITLVFGGVKLKFFVDETKSISHVFKTISDEVVKDEDVSWDWAGCPADLCGRADGSLATSPIPNDPTGIDDNVPF